MNEDRLPPVIQPVRPGKMIEVGGTKLTLPMGVKMPTPKQTEPARPVAMTYHERFLDVTKHFPKMPRAWRRKMARRNAPR